MRTRAPATRSFVAAAPRPRAEKKVPQFFETYAEKQTKRRKYDPASRSFDGHMGARSCFKVSIETSETVRHDNKAIAIKKRY